MLKQLLFQKEILPSYKICRGNASRYPTPGYKFCRDEASSYPEHYFGGKGAGH
jgi:hypothetical protein